MNLPNIPVDALVYKIGTTYRLYQILRMVCKTLNQLKDWEDVHNIKYELIKDMDEFTPHDISRKEFINQINSRDPCKTRFIQCKINGKIHFQMEFTNGFPDIINLYKSNSINGLYTTRDRIEFPFVTSGGEYFKIYLNRYDVDYIGLTSESEKEILLRELYDYFPEIFCNLVIIRRYTGKKYAKLYY